MMMRMMPASKALPCGSVHEGSAVFEKTAGGWEDLAKKRENSYHAELQGTRVLYEVLFIQEVAYVWYV